MLQERDRKIVSVARFGLILVRAYLDACALYRISRSESGHSVRRGGSDYGFSGYRFSPTPRGIKCHTYFINQTSHSSTLLGTFSGTITHE